jgi:hypothetical protein
MNNITDETSDYRIFVASTYFVLNVFGLSVYTVFAIALIIDRINFKDTFYILVVHLAIGNIGTLFCHFVIAFPLTLTGFNIYGDSLLPIIGNFLTMFFFVYFLLSFLIALDRFIIFVFPSKHRFLFDIPNIHYVSVCTYIFAVIYSLCSTIADCPKWFDTTRFNFYFKCSSDMSAFGHYYLIGFSYFAVILPVVIFLLYIAILIKIKLMSITAIINSFS